ncbi:HWE histidine kinase domain-containing protein [Sulfitobacter sp. LCG007]
MDQRIVNRTSAWLFELRHLLSHNRRLSLRIGHLMVLFGGLLILPAVAFLAYVLSDLQEQSVRAAESYGRARVDEIVDRLDAEIAVQSTMLAVFARSGWLQEGALESLHRRARSILSGQNLNLLVLDETGMQLVNTRVDYGTPLGLSSDEDARALARGEIRPEVSGFFHGKIANALVFNVTRVVNMPDGSRRVLILARNVDTFKPALAGAAAAGWTVELRDQSGLVALLDGPLADRPENDIPCIAETAAKDGEVVLLQQLRSADWTVCAWADTRSLVGGDHVAWNFLAVVLAWSSVALIAAVFVGRFLSGTIRQTAQMAAGLGAGLPVVASPCAIREVDGIRTALKRAADAQSERERERTIILDETAHRARNQMTLAISLVNLTANSSDDVAEMKDKLNQRLTSLGRAIDVAESARRGHLTLKDVIESQLLPFVGDDALRLGLSGEKLDVDRAAGQSLALIFHELSTNAMKHGAWSVEGGRVDVDWRTMAGNLVLDWVESGRSAVASERKGFGSRLLTALIETAFGGSIERTYAASGYSCRIVVPMDAVSARNS